MYISMCDKCVRRIGPHYLAIEVPGSEREGECRNCFKILTIRQYDVTPRRRPRKARTGGGEREKAGRRA